MAFDVEGARKAGYTDAEIAAHLAEQSSFDLKGARASGYSDGEVIAHLTKPARADAIPVATTPEQKAKDKAPAATWAEPSQAPAGVVDTAIGTGEVALSTATGMLGMIGGTLKGLAEQILAGNFGTQEAAALVEQSANEVAQAVTRAPRTPSGQRQAAAVAEAMQHLVPVMGLGATLAGPAGAIGRSAGAVRTGAAAVLDKAATGVPAAMRELPGRVMQAVQQDGGAVPQSRYGSVGAAATDVGAQRRALAADFPIPIKLTKGEASRDAAQLKFETEAAKAPDTGAPLREHRIHVNGAILDNLDTWIDQTGAQAPSLRAVGAAVDKALVEKAQRAKTEVNVKYRKADNSPEALIEVNPSLSVSIGEGEQALTASPISYLNSKPSGLNTTGLTDHAKQYAVKLGIAEMVDNELVAKPATVKQMEAWRKEISQATGYEPMDIRDSTILKKLIDGQTEPLAGPLYRQARAARAQYAREFKDRSVIAKLLGNKRGTMDRQVAFEDVFQHSILKGSLDDVRTVRKTLQTAGSDGQQAWRELQGQALRDIRDKATSSVNTDSSGNRIVSPDKLDKAIKALDADGKLDFIFTKKGAQQLRDINELAAIARTVPPEAAVNFSNTASTLLAAFGDVGMTAFSGIPAPVATTVRLARAHIKDARLRQRIAEALGETERKQQRLFGRKPPTTSPTSASGSDTLQ